MYSGNTDYQSETEKLLFTNYQIETISNYVFDNIFYLLCYRSQKKKPKKQKKPPKTIDQSVKQNVKMYQLYL